MGEERSLWEKRQRDSERGTTNIFFPDLKEKKIEELSQKNTELTDRLSHMKTTKDTVIKDLSAEIDLLMKGT